MLVNKQNHRSLPYQRESLHIERKKLTNKRAVWLYQTFNVTGISIYSWFEKSTWNSVTMTSVLILIFIVVVTVHQTWAMLLGEVLVLRDYTDPTKCALENDLAEHQFFSRVATSASQRATREKNWCEARSFSQCTWSWVRVMPLHF